ncbi:MAG: hypothetical protein ACKPKO_30130, partial [Candidatus Fonsibacter sp.]
ITLYQTIFDYLSGLSLELVYCLRRLQQLALEVFRLLSPQGTDARADLLTVLLYHTIFDYFILST